MPFAPKIILMLIKHIKIDHIYRVALIFQSMCASYNFQINISIFISSNIFHFFVAKTFSVFLLAVLKYTIYCSHMKQELNEWVFYQDIRILHFIHFIKFKGKEGSPYSSLLRMRVSPEFYKVAQLLRRHVADPRRPLASSLLLCPYHRGH